MVSAFGRAEAQVDVDLELVLAVDASGSVDQQEYALQIQGIAASFRDETVLAALRSGAQGRIAVALVTWADSATPRAQMSSAQMKRTAKRVRGRKP